MKIVSENNAICRRRVGRNFGVAQFICTADRELCQGCDVWTTTADLSLCIQPPLFCRKDQTECVLCDNRSICCYYSILSRASKSNTVCLLRQACVFTEICLGLHSLRVCVPQSLCLQLSLFSWSLFHYKLIWLIWKRRTRKRCMHKADLAMIMSPTVCLLLWSVKLSILAGATFCKLDASHTHKLWSGLRISGVPSEQAVLALPFCKSHCTSLLHTHMHISVTR